MQTMLCCCRHYSRSVDKGVDPVWQRLRLPTYPAVPATALEEASLSPSPLLMQSAALGSPPLIPILPPMHENLP